MTEEAQSAESAPEVSRNVVATRASRTWVVAIILAVIAAVVFFKSSKPNQEHFDYTFRIAGALLHGQVGLETRPPSWLNEMVPLEGHFYSVFPLGAVLTMIPVAILQRAGWIQNFPGHWIAAIIVACVVYFSLRLTEILSQTFARRIAFGSESRDVCARSIRIGIQ